MLPTEHAYAGENYFRYLQGVRTGEQHPSAGGIKPHEYALLAEVSVHWYERAPLTIRDAIHLRHLGSPATLHKRITWLRQWSWLSVIHHDSDHRVKYLIPSDRALAHFASRGQMMQTAMRTRAVIDNPKALSNPHRERL